VLALLARPLFASLRAVLNLYPLVGLLLRLLLSNSVALLQLTYELIAHSRNLLQIVIGELTPLLFCGSANLFPFAFYLVPIHTNRFSSFMKWTHVPVGRMDRESISDTTSFVGQSIACLSGGGFYIRTCLVIHCWRVHLSGWSAPVAVRIDEGGSVSVFNSALMMKGTYMNNKGHICGFLLGLSVGGSVALLFAPRPGKKTRTQIAQAATDGVTYVKECGEAVRDATGELVERGKEEIARQKDGIKRGVEAYQETVR
jgi:gas vesicle protein